MISWFRRRSKAQSFGHVTNMARGVGYTLTHYIRIHRLVQVAAPPQGKHVSSQ